MPDGSLIKDLKRIYFHQKKDLRKIELFEKLMTRLFSQKIKLFRRVDRTDTTCVYANSKTLAYFLYYTLNFSKSDEEMRVPKWIFGSPKSVKLSYLKEVFDMEGTILKKLTEIRFVTKDKKFAIDIQKLLHTIGIRSWLTYAPRIKQKSGQFRLSVYRKENFIKFKEINFRIPHLRTRFEDLLTKYKI